jgi:3-keto-5-aminohexanoate cleavage enzyme
MKPEEYLYRLTDDNKYMEKIEKGMPPLIISVAITGGAHGKEANPALPETPEEQAQSAYEAYQAGASIIHIHARQPENTKMASIDPELYRHIAQLIREKCPDAIINFTTAGGFGLTIEERLACLEARPEVASLDPNPILFPKGLYTVGDAPSDRPVPTDKTSNEYERFIHLEMIRLFGIIPQGSWLISDAIAERCNQYDVKPELEIWDPHDIKQIQYLIAQQKVKPPYLIQLVMGPLNAMPSTPMSVMHYMEKLPEESIISVIGIGQHQLHLNLFSIVMGAHVRTGMEDNVYYKKGELAQSNGQLVERLAWFAQELGREVATPLQARQMLGLSETPRQY